MQIITPDIVAHPDYQDGHPAYFDISVRNTTQPSFISSSPHVLEWLLLLDKKHLSAVEKVGSDFIPLVVELLECGLRLP